jgi:hypothetical protein
VGAVDVPVTLKFRTGWDRENKNALKIARIAEDAGIAMLTLHGRTRADGYKGDAEYDTIAAVKQSVSIPVVANGDITTPEKAALCWITPAPMPSWWAAPRRAGRGSSARSTITCAPASICRRPTWTKCAR